MDKTPKVFLQHIQDSIQRIEKYVSEYSYEQFEGDLKTQDAVIRQLEIIGEATSNLETNFKKMYPKIPWRDIADFRNVLAHEYWDIDLEIVWRAVKEDLQVLEVALLPIIAEVVN